MVVIRCENINPVFWAYVTEYARKKRVERCEALNSIIEEHMKFTAKAYEEKIGARKSAKEK